MTNYKVHYFRKPECPSSLQCQKVTLDLVDLAHAAVSETLTAGGPISAFSNQLSAFLTAKQCLTWKGNGPGIGRELRRSYSNIHGRVFARAYLEKCEGVVRLVPIEGNPFIFANQIVVRLKDDQKGDMPDWLGWDSSGIVVAEAKGTHAKGDWWKTFYTHNSLPQCLKKAQEQVNRVQVRYGNTFNLEFDGWSVASRWATEENGFEPWLAAIRSRLDAQSPTDDARPLTGDARRDVILALQKTAFSRVIYGLGYSDENPFGRIGSSEVVPPTDFNGRGDRQRKVKIREAPLVRGLNSVYFNGAFFPIQSDEELKLFRDRRVRDGQVWLVTALHRALNATEKDEILEEQETSRSPTHLSRNGLAITKVEDARIVN